MTLEQIGIGIAATGLVGGGTAALLRLLVVATKTHTKVDAIMTNHLPHIQAEVTKVSDQLVTHLQEHINKQN